MNRCPSCGKEQPAEHHFCPACGTALTESGATARGERGEAEATTASAAEPARSVSRTLGLPFLLVLALAVLVLGGVAFASGHPPPAAAVPLPSATATGTPPATPEPTATMTPSPSATATARPTMTPTPTATATPTATPTPLPTATPVPYRTEQLRVPPHSTQSVTYTITQPPGRFEGYILILGANNDIGFRLRNPDGGYLVNQSRVANRYAFDIPLPEAGPYTLFLDNSFSLITAKDVTMYARILGSTAGQ